MLCLFSTIVASRNISMISPNTKRSALECTHRSFIVFQITYQLQTRISSFLFTSLFLAVRINLYLYLTFFFSLHARVQLFQLNIWIQPTIQREINARFLLVGSISTKKFNLNLSQGNFGTNLERNCQKFTLFENQQLNNKNS